MKPHGQRVLITGAARGIGAETARQLAAQGATPVEALVKTVEVNLIGVIRTVSATLPAITNSQGYFLLVSSAAALKSMPGTSAYAASKSGVDHFANALRLEVAHKGVDVGVVYPAWIDTDLVRDQRRELASFNDALKQLPWPFNVVTSVEDCSWSMVSAVNRRQRKTYVPAALAPIGAIRQLFMSPLWEFFVKRKARVAVPKVEAEVVAIGRSFGASSMGHALTAKQKED